jgi:hypothetical protein
VAAEEDVDLAGVEHGVERGVGLALHVPWRFGVGGGEGKTSKRCTGRGWPARGARARRAKDAQSLCTSATTHGVTLRSTAARSAATKASWLASSSVPERYVYASAEKPM